MDSGRVASRASHVHDGGVILKGRGLLRPWLWLGLGFALGHQDDRRRMVVTVADGFSPDAFKMKVSIFCMGERNRSVSITA